MSARSSVVLARACPPRARLGFGPLPASRCARRPRGDHDGSTRSRARCLPSARRRRGPTNSLATWSKCSNAACCAWLRSSAATTSLYGSADHPLDSCDDQTPRPRTRRPRRSRVRQRPSACDMRGARGTPFLRPPRAPALRGPRAAGAHRQYRTAPTRSSAPRTSDRSPAPLRGLRARRASRRTEDLPGRPRRAATARSPCRRGRARELQIRSTGLLPRGRQGSSPQRRWKTLPA